MPRPDPVIAVTDTERRDLIAPIQAGKPLKTAPHVHPQPGRYTVAVKVIGIFGNDTMTLLPVNVG